MTQKVTAAETKPISVIIVEDFKLTRVGLRCALNANDDINVVAEAEDALEGLKLIERHRPDVILMDLDRKSTRLNSSHMPKSRMPSSA